MENTFSYVYEVYPHDDFPDEPLLFKDRYQASKYAQYCANYYQEPITVAVRLHGSAKRICELTIYPDMKEE